MGRQIVIRSSPVASTGQKLLLTSPSGSPSPARPIRKCSSNVGEVAGGAAADCCVVCCCCPCVLLEFVVLVVYKARASFLRLIVKKWRLKNLKKKKKKKNGGLSGLGSDLGGLHYAGYYDAVSDADLREFEMIKVSIDGSPEAIQLDKEMWEQFHNAGFWRSQSQRFT